VAVADISFETPIKVIFFVGLDSTPSNWGPSPPKSLVICYSLIILPFGTT
jgi:hypothetical protein